MVFRHRGGGDNIGENCVVFDCGSELYDLQLSEFCPKIVILHGGKGGGWFEERDYLTVLIFM